MTSGVAGSRPAPRRTARPKITATAGAPCAAPAEGPGLWAAPSRTRRRSPSPPPPCSGSPCRHFRYSTSSPRPVPPSCPSPRAKTFTRCPGMQTIALVAQNHCHPRWPAAMWRLATCDTRSTPGPGSRRARPPPRPGGFCCPAGIPARAPREARREACALQRRPSSIPRPGSGPQSAPASWRRGRRGLAYSGSVHHPRSRAFHAVPATSAGQSAPP